MDYLNGCNVVTKSLNSKMKGEERKEVINDLLSDSPVTKMLYVTPEQVATVKFTDLLNSLVRAGKLGSFVIDEAHCVSQVSNFYSHKAVSFTIFFSGDMNSDQLT